MPLGLAPLPGCGADGPLELALPVPLDLVDAGGEGGEVPDALADLPAQDHASSGPPAPVLFGVTATPRPGADGATARKEAQLLSFAAGARGVVVSRTWRELDAAAWNELAVEAKLLEQHGATVFFRLEVIGGKADHRPIELAMASWDSGPTLAAAHEAVDQARAVYGPALRYFVIGEEVDRYLDEHPLERAPFVAFAAQVCAYVRTSSPRAATTVGAVGFSQQAAAAGSSAFVATLAACDAAALSYLPIEPSGAAADPSRAGDDLALASLAAGEKPVLLASLSYPVEGEGGSEARQRAFVVEATAAVGARRARFPFVNLDMLHDLDKGACAALLATQAEPPDGPFAARRCSLGLHGDDGVARPAWGAALEAAALFAAP